MLSIVIEPVTLREPVILIIGVLIVVVDVEPVINKDPVKLNTFDNVSYLKFCAESTVVVGVVE